MLSPASPPLRPRTSGRRLRPRRPMGVTTRHAEAERRLPARERPGEVRRPGLAPGRARSCTGSQGDPIAVPAPRVGRGHAAAGDDPDGVHRGDDHHRVVGELGGHRVRIGVEAHQRERVDAPGLRPGDYERLGRRGRRRRLLPGPPGPGIAAPPPEVGVERLDPAADRRDRHEEVAAGEAEDRLDVPLPSDRPSVSAGPRDAIPATVTGRPIWGSRWLTTGPACPEPAGRSSSSP